MTRVSVKRELLEWAWDRSGLVEDKLLDRFPKFEAWKRGDEIPTLRQLEGFAKATHTPIGYFFLASPPIERVPIPDFRTIENELIDRPSPDLLDTIYICQQRQDWYRTHAQTVGEPPLEFVGSAARSTDITASANQIRSQLKFSVEERSQMNSWTDALRRFIDQVDALGVLVMVTSVVGSNNRRKLDPGEFRGFALSDALAPLIFVNGSDTKAAQMFTLAHELAHIWRAQSALSDVGPITSPSNDIEVWCNKVAAELLVPLTSLRRVLRPIGDIREEMTRLARHFKVSTLVILRRLHDAGALTREQLRATYTDELARLTAITRSSGGDYYLSTSARVGKRFARAVIASTWEGRSTFSEAFHLLGCRKMATFRELGQTLGVGP